MEWGNAKPGQLCGFDADGNRVGIDPVRQTGIRFVCEVSGPVQLLACGDRVIVVGPNQPASYVTENGIEPIPIAGAQ